MIARVRIAPVERWCDEARAGNVPDSATVAGNEILIFTESCRLRFVWRCGGKEWKVEDDSSKRFREAIGKQYVPGIHSWICEHMLEMD